MYHWFQVPVTQAEIMEQNKEIMRGTGYRQVNKNGDSCIEYHVDDLSQEMINKIVPNLPCGGNLSVQKKQEEKPIIQFGHDECIFHQYIFTSHCWYGPKGETTIIPKDEGYRIMISTFQSWQFGFGMHLSEDELKRVNEF